MFVLTDAVSSRETTELSIQGGICRRLQQIPPGEERRPIHRFQQARHASETHEESSTRAAPQVLLLHDKSPRLRYKQAQRPDLRRLKQISAA